MSFDDARIVLVRWPRLRLDELDIELVLIAKIENVKETLFQAQLQFADGGATRVSNTVDNSQASRPGRTEVLLPA